MIAKLATPLHLRHCLGKTGGAAVEFAMTAPLLVVVALGVADYGALMTNSASLEGATRAIAEYARNSAACNVIGNAGSWLQNSNCVTGIQDFAGTLKSNDTFLSSGAGATFSLPPSADLTAPADLSASGGNYCNCPDANGTVVDCATVTTCNVGGVVKPVVQYIRISATQNFTPMLSYVTLGFPASLSGQTTIRIQ